LKKLKASSLALTTLDIHCYELLPLTQMKEINLRHELFKLFTSCMLKDAWLLLCPETLIAKPLHIFSYLPSLLVTLPTQLPLISAPPSQTSASLTGSISLRTPLGCTSLILSLYSCNSLRYLSLSLFPYSLYTCTKEEQSKRVKELVMLDHFHALPK